jgi:hypothetical protein
MSIPIEQQIKFLREVVIPSFGEHPDDKNERLDWIRAEADVLFPTLSDAQRESLIRLSKIIDTLEEAEKELDQLIQQQASKLISIYFIIFNI